MSLPVALTPSPSPIRWERVAAGRVRGMDVVAGVSVHKYLRPSVPPAVRGFGLRTTGFLSLTSDH